MKEIPHLRTAIGNVLADFRWSRKFTKTALAESAGLELRYVFEIEKGTRNPSVGVIFLLLGALGVRPGEFFQRVEEECLRLEALDGPEPDENSSTPQPSSNPACMR